MIQYQKCNDKSKHIMIENGTDVQKRPCGPGQLASEFGINFGKNRYDFCIRTRITAIIRKVMTAA